MKLTKLFGLFVFSAILGLSFAACSDDDDNVIDNSAVVGTWDYVGVTPTVEFTKEYLEGKTPAQITEVTKKVMDRMTELANLNDDLITTGSQFGLKADYSYEFKYLSGEATKTITGKYAYTAGQKGLTFTTPTESVARFVKDYALDGTSMTYKADIDKNKIIGVGLRAPVEELPGTAIKSAVVTVEYTKKAK